jgi:hypothetical protein
MDAEFGKHVDGKHPTPDRMINRLWTEVRIQNLSNINGMSPVTHKSALHL